MFLVFVVKCIGVGLIIWRIRKLILAHKDIMTRDDVIEILSKGGSLVGANLMGIDLSGIDLSGTDLHNANLRRTNLYGADLTVANLSNTDLRGAVLSHADLSVTDLTGAKGPLMDFRRGKNLTEPLIGYKKCRGGVIVTLEIPKDATVFSINGDKCRTNKVKVLAVDGADRGLSHYKHMSYYVGDEITIKNFDWRYNVECATGIHFFMNRKDAKNYVLR